MADGRTFFFSSRRRHTRSLCDWSSDVCSSDLQSAPIDVIEVCVREQHEIDWGKLGKGQGRFGEPFRANRRSEERRVGKECRSRWAPDLEKEKQRKLEAEHTAGAAECTVHLVDV